MRKHVEMHTGRDAWDTGYGMSALTVYEELQDHVTEGDHETTSRNDGRAAGCDHALIGMVVVLEHED